jgi:hypothetical protein
MNARATLSNGRTVKENGGGTVVFRVKQDIGNLKMYAKYKDSGGMNLQKYLQHD